MGAPDIEKKLKIGFEPMFISDENFRPLFTALLKKAYLINQSGLLKESEKEAAILFSGIQYGAPETSSYKYEPETAFVKPTTDIVLIGHAHTQKPNTSQVDVGLRVGPVQKVARVIGDRYLIKNGNSVSVQGPLQFDKIPLVYERAFGGWDRNHPNPEKHHFDPHNPVGVGFGHPTGNPDEPVRLPNIENPNRLWRGWGDRPPPAGFGFISPHWQPRASFAGTYDKNWEETRKPLLPTDFDRRFFNAASPGLIAPGYLRGDEAVVIVNASPEGKLAFNLPGVPPPCCRISLKGGKEEILQTQLDTVIINTDENLVFLLWRAHMVVRNGPHDVLAIEIDTPAKTHAPRAT